jgi:hypothetical protein
VSGRNYILLFSEYIQDTLSKHAPESCKTMPESNSALDLGDKCERSTDGC